MVFSMPELTEHVCSSKTSLAQSPSKVRMVLGLHFKEINCFYKKFFELFAGENFRKKESCGK